MWNMMWSMMWNTRQEKSIGLLRKKKLEKNQWMPCFVGLISPAKHGIQ